MSNKKLFYTISLFILSTFSVFSQQKQSIDSTKQLNEVVVRGFETERKLSETAASVNVLTIKDIQRFENMSLVPVLNTLPGVRMEERSPGSYRLAIRGSSLRSPFGVRNVKVYWNDIPLTDGNGNTFLNSLDMNTIGNIEVIKGPAGSIYGAGTGGVVLLGGAKADGNNTRKGHTNYINTGVAYGSYGLQNRNISWNVASEKVNSVLSYAHAQTDGYRQNSAAVRDVLNWRSNYFVSANKTLNISTLYSDIHYQTPGGLNQAQFEKDPSLSRQATATLPSSIQQKAGIYQKLFNIGVSQEYRLNAHWTNVTSIYGTVSELRNPFITNYEIRNEQTFGGRSRMNYSFDVGNLKNRFTVGGELQKSAWVIRNFGNKAGVIDTLQTNDNVAAWNYFLFGQLETDLPQNFILTIGGSYNRFKYDFTRLSDAPKIKPISELLPAAFLPRIALLKKIQDKISVFASVSSGFSPPTVTEYISGYQNSSFVPSLAPEKGINYEIGTRGNLLKKRINFDITAYSFRLKNTIVRRTDNTGREIFTNAGSTLQNGLELLLNGLIIKSIDKEFIQELRVFTSYTFNDYSFKNYLQLKTDLSGNTLTGVPRQVWVSGVDLQTKMGFYLNSTLNFTDRIPLNDANSTYANSYKLLNVRISYRKNFERIGLNIYTAGDNLLNEIYSLGNDINAVGNRYFNTAAPRNWQFGASLSLFL
jgi:iron complex outermembrane receptor protein